MTTLARYLVSILDDNRLPTPTALTNSRLAVALGAERIGRDEFTAILSMDKESNEIWVAHAEWSQKFEYKKFLDIDSAWRCHTSEWFSDCIIATSKIAIILPATDSFFIVIYTQDIMKEHEREFSAMNSRFHEWSTDEIHSEQFIAFMSALMEKYALLINLTST